MATRKDGQGVYAAAFNLSAEERTVTITAEMLEGGYTCATELWTKEAADPSKGLSVTLKPHDAAVWLVK